MTLVFFAEANNAFVVLLAIAICFASSTFTVIAYQIVWAWMRGVTLQAATTRIIAEFGTKASARNSALSRCTITTGTAAIIGCYTRICCLAYRYIIALENTNAGVTRRRIATSSAY